MKSPKSITVGTRGSSLALRQTELLIGELKKIQPRLEVAIRKITTSGDKIQDRFLSSEGGKGLFVKEIEEALMGGEIDFAVHSYKDLPAVTPASLSIGCVPVRADPRDVLVSRDGISLDRLKEGALIGTSSLRRRSQILQKRPDVRFELLRGNIDSRMRKLQDGMFDAIVLAKAGMKRLGMDISSAVDLPIVPAPGQGALAIQIRGDDRDLAELMQPLHDEATAGLVAVERKIMERLGGDCALPLGACCRMVAGGLEAEAFVGTHDGRRVCYVKEVGALDDADSLAESMVAALLKQGAEEIMKASRMP